MSYCRKRGRPRNGLRPSVVPPLPLTFPDRTQSLLTPTPAFVEARQVSLDRDPSRGHVEVSDTGLGLGSGSVNDTCPLIHYLEQETSVVPTCLPGLLDLSLSDFDGV